MRGLIQPTLKDQQLALRILADNNILEPKAELYLQEIRARVDRAIEKTKARY